MAYTIKNAKTGKDEVWLNIAESSDYIGKSRTTFTTAVRKYEQQTGQTVQTLLNGHERLYLKEDLDKFLVEMYPFVARQKGLLT